MSSSYIPATITAGDSLSWTITDADHPASAGWVLKYYLVKTGKQIEIESTPDGDAHAFALAPADTAAWPAGRYKYQAVATKDATDRATIDAGHVDVAVNFAAQADGYDAREHAEVVLDALYAVAACKATEDQASISIGDRALTHMSPGQINDWIKIYEAKVARLNNAQRKRRGLATRRYSKVRFS
jgi:hypothetical protein